jgi:acetylornithine deacetylase/succinyl-diaminopimelate desuccinylase-like protein
VRADPEEWTVDPWSGELRDGEIWGRGALDMKSHVAAARSPSPPLAREGFVPAGDVVFVASADEEVGEDFGLSWLCANHPDAIRAEYCVNEGGGDRLLIGGRPAYLCGTAEKMSSPFLLRVHGRSGHASMPGLRTTRSCVRRALIQRLAEYRRRPEPCPRPRLPRARGYERPRAARAARPGDRRADALALHLADDHRGVEATERHPGCLRCRLRLPAAARGNQDEAEAEIRAALGEDNYDSSWLEGVGGTASPLDTPLWSAIESFVAGEEPGAALAPFVNAGFTDSHFMREAFGTVCYGFFPMRAMDSEVAAALIHSADERIPWTTSSSVPASSCTWHVHSESEQGQGSPRRDGPRQRRARARAALLGLRDSPRGRGPGGRLRAQAAARGRDREPLVRGPARMAEVFALLPEIRRRLPAAQLPFQRPAWPPRWSGARLPSGSSAAAGSRRRPGGLAALLAVGPRRRHARVEPGRVPRSRAHLDRTYEHGEDRAKEHERCGSHLLGPLL